jgi:maleate isomerase
MAPAGREREGDEWRDRTVPLGIILPGDSYLDDEIWRLTAGKATPFITRTRGASNRQMQLDPVQEVTALAESPDIEDAADRLRAISPAAAAYVDTSISFVRGPGGDVEIAQRVHRCLKCPTTVTSTALVDACRAFGVTRVSAVTPYPDALNATLAPFLAGYGISVTNLVKLEYNYEKGMTSQDMAGADPEELVTSGRKADRPESQAIIIACTALRTLEAIEPLEDAVHKPVFSAVQATIWRVLRLAGSIGDAPLGGVLFEKT